MSTIESGTYTLDPTHSRLGFVARHAMITKVRGTFTETTGTGTFDADNPAASSFQVTLSVDSIDTGNADRDGHLRSNDFFDLAQYPTITFASTSVSGSGDSFEVTGDLTVKGVTKSITFPLEYTGTAQDPFGNTRIGLEGSTTINRKDFGLTWNAVMEAGGVLVSDKITLEFDVSAIRDA